MREWAAFAAGRARSGADEAGSKAAAAVTDRFLPEEPA